MSAHVENWEGLEVAGGRYTVTGMLGEGGMGQVYQAWDHNLNTNVVLKVPLREVFKNRDLAERFAREIRSLVELIHPHIVRITDVGEHEELPFAVLQYMQGGSLEDRRQNAIDSGERIPLDDLKTWLPQVAASLDFIHARQYIHRDVKPGNVLFDGNNNAYLGDFGIARAHAEHTQDEGQSRLTGQNIVLGTPEYMAPELVRAQDFDGRVDQYALAVTAYEMICLRVPFEGPPSAVLVAQTAEEPPPPTQFAPHLPAAAEAVLLRGMAKDAGARYANCVEFAEAMVAAISGVDTSSGMTAHDTATLSAPGSDTESYPAPGTPAGGMAGRARTMVEQPAVGQTPAGLQQPLTDPGFGRTPTLPDGMPAAAGSAAHPAIPQESGRKFRVNRYVAISAAAVAVALATYFIGRVTVSAPAVAALAPDEEIANLPLSAADSQRDFTNVLGMKMVAVNPGRYKAGASANDWATIEYPYWVAAHETTVLQYLQFVKATNENQADDQQRKHQPVWMNEDAQEGYQALQGVQRRNGSPIVGITRTDAEAFCRWLTQQAPDGLVYRLPTPAEWVAACRGGTETPYWWGEQREVSMCNCEGDQDGEATLARTGRFAPNPWGLHEVSGNVAEMLHSRNPSVQAAGGSWESSEDAEIAATGVKTVTVPARDVGFRIVAVRTAEAVPPRQK